MSYDSLILAAGSLVSYWKLDETSGTSAADSQGSNTGTYTGGFTLNQAGTPDTAVLLNGTTGYITVPSASGLHPASVSVECWVNPDSGALNSRGFVTSNQKTSNIGYELGIDITESGFNQWEFGTYNGSWHTAITSMPSAAGWVHLVGTYDGTNLKLYVNGILVKTTAFAGPLVYDNNAFSIGRAYNNNRFTKGLIDAVAIYSAALSQADIAKHYQVGNSLKAMSSFGARPVSVRGRIPKAMVSCVPCIDRDWAAGNSGPKDFVSNRRGTVNSALGKNKDAFGNGFSASNDSANNGNVILWDTVPAYGGNKPFSVALLTALHGWYTGINAATQLWGNTHDIGSQTKIKITASADLLSTKFTVGTTVLTVTPPLPMEVPTLLVGTSDGSTVFFYVNGRLVASGALAGASGGTYTQSAFVSATDGDRSAAAELHGLYIFTRCLTQDEVSAYYRDFWWPFRTKSLVELFAGIKPGGGGAGKGGGGKNQGGGKGGGKGGAFWQTTGGAQSYLVDCDV